MAGSVIGDLLIRIGIDAAAVESGLSKTEKRVEQFGNQLFTMGTRITAGVSLPLAAAEGAIVHFGVAFDNAMTESLAIMDGVTPKIRTQMEEVAIAVSNAGKFSAVEAAQGFYDLASAGLDASTAMGALPIAANFAQAGVMKLSQATEYLASAQAALAQGSEDSATKVKQMARIADVLTEANNRALGTVQDFAAALTNKAGAAMRQFNISLEQGVAVLATYAAQGTKGKVAGQQFMMVIRDLTTYAIKNADAFKKFGISVYDSVGNMKNMADIIQDIERATAQMNVEQKTSMLLQLGIPLRSVAATRALIGYSAAIRENEAALAKQGTTAEVAAKQMQSVQNQFLQLTHQLENVGNTIFEAFKPILKDVILPKLKGLVTWLQNLADQFKAAPNWVKYLTLGFSAIVIAAGPLITALGSVVLLGGAVMRAMTGLAATLGDAAVGMATYLGASKFVVLSETEVMNAAYAAAQAAKAHALAQGLEAEAAIDVGIAESKAVIATNAANAARVESLASVGGLSRAWAGFTGILDGGLTMLAGSVGTLALWGAGLAVAIPLISGIVEGLGGWGALLGVINPALMVMSGLLGKDLATEVGGAVSTISNMFFIIEDGLKVVGQSFGELMKDIASSGKSLIDDLVNGIKNSLKSIPVSGTYTPAAGGGGGGGGGIDVYTESIVNTRALNTLYEQSIDSWKKINDEVMENGGGMEGLAHITARWRDDLHLIANEQKINKELAQQWVDLLEKASETKPPQVLPQALPGAPSEWSKKFWEDANLLTLSQQEFNKRMKEAQHIGQDTFDVLDSGAKKFQSDVDAMTNSIMGFTKKGSSEMDVLVAVWNKHRNEIFANEGMLNKFGDAYLKLSAETNQTNAVFENMFGVLRDGLVKSKKDLNEWGDIFGSMGNSVIGHIDDVLEAYGQMDSAAKKNAFFKNISSGMESIAPFFDEMPPKVQTLIKAYLEWKATSQDTMRAAAADIKKAQDAISSGLDKIQNDFEDKQFQVSLFGYSYGDTEVKNLRRASGKIRHEYQDMINKMIDDASRLPEQEQFDAYARIRTAEQTANKIVAINEMEGKRKIAISLGVNQNLIRNWATVSEAEQNAAMKQAEFWKLAAERMKPYVQMTGDLASLFGSLGNAALSASLSAASGAMANLIGGVEQMTQKGAGAGDVIAGGVKAVLGLVQAWQTLINTVGKGNRAMTGAMMGAQIGSIFGPAGAAIGAGIGALVGALMKDPRWKRVQDAWSKQLGVAISDGTAKAIDEMAKSKFGNQLDVSRVFNFDKIIVDAGGVTTRNIDTLARSFRDLFVFVRTGQMGIKDATDALSRTFPAFGDAVAKSNQIASRSFLDLIHQAAVFKMNIQEITDFLIGQMSVFGDNFGKVIDSLAGKYTGLADKIKDARDKLAKDQKEGKGSDVERDTAELNALLDQQKQAAAGAAGSIKDAGTIILAMFSAGMANGLGFTDAIKAISPALDTLIARMKDLGIASDNVALNILIMQRNMVNANPALFEGLDALEKSFIAASKIPGALTPDSFVAFEHSAKSMYDELVKTAVAAGGTQKDALLAILPMLENLAKASKEYGFTLDENTLKLIQQAKDQGIWTDEALSTNQVLAEGFAAIIEALGGEVPQALKDMLKETKDVTDGMASKFETTSKEIQAYLDGINGPNITVKYHYEQQGPGIPPVVVANGDGDGDGDNDPHHHGGPPTNPPHFARGGVLTGPKTILAGEAGPEAITPLDLMFAKVKSIVDTAVNGRQTSGDVFILPVRTTGSHADDVDAILATLPVRVKQNHKGLRTKLIQALDGTVQ